MKILVTGGAGFIGSNFIRHIFNKYPGYHVTNLDKLTYCGNLDNLADVEDISNYEFIHGDITDAGLVENVMKEVDCVINFAAETHVDRSIMDASQFVMTDVYGTFVLAEAAKKYKIKRFLQISTDEVYGSIKEGAIKEDGRLNPSSPYASSKAGAELLAQSYYVTYKLPVIVLRPSNNFGPYQYPEKFIPLFITNALMDEPLPIYGDGKNVRDWLYVEDTCRAIDVLLHHGEAGEAYNIGGECEKTNIEITRTILKKLNKPESLMKFVKDRPGHDLRYGIDSSKVNKLGFVRRFTFDTAIKETLEWYIQNQDWWKKIKSGEFEKYYEKQYEN